MLSEAPLTPGRSPTLQGGPKWSPSAENMEPFLETERNGFEDFQSFLATVEMDLFDWWRGFAYRGDAEDEFAAMLNRDLLNQPRRSPPQYTAHTGYWRPSYPSAGGISPWRNDEGVFARKTSSRLRQAECPPADAYSPVQPAELDLPAPPPTHSIIGNPPGTEERARDASCSGQKKSAIQPAREATDQADHKRDKLVWKTLLRRIADGVKEVADYVQYERTGPAIARLFSRHSATWKKGMVYDAYAVISGVSDVSSQAQEIVACFAILDKHPNLAAMARSAPVLKYLMVLARRACVVVKCEPREWKFWGLEQIPPKCTRQYELLAEGVSAVFFSLPSGQDMQVRMGSSRHDVPLRQAALLHFTAPCNLRCWTITNPCPEPQLILLGAM